VLRTHVGVAVLAIAGGALVLGGLIAHLAHVGPVAVAVTAVFAMTSAANLLLLAVPNGIRAMGVVAGALVAASAVYAAVVAVLLVLGWSSITLVLAGGVLGNVVGIAIVLGWSRRRAPLGNGPEVRGRAVYLDALRFGAPAGVGELLLLAMLRIDVLVVAWFLPLREVGLYAVALALTEVLWVLPDGIAQVVLPTTGRDPKRSRTAWLLCSALLATAAAGVVLIGVDQWVLELAFGSRFADAATAVPLLVVACLAGGAWKIGGAEIVARGRTGPRATSALAGLATMVLVDVVAVPSMGIRGAALGSAVGYAVAAGIIGHAWREMVQATRNEPRTARSRPGPAEVATTLEGGRSVDVEVSR
jgi:O-antigen/teichoic acid export membrane protein